jgi:hypothetical protein
LLLLLLLLLKEVLGDAAGAENWRKACRVLLVFKFSSAAAKVANFSFCFSRRRFFQSSTL